MRRPTRYVGLSMKERAAARRKEFTEAGIELFGTRGVAASKVADICRHAGLTERYFYESFDSVEEFVHAVAETVAIRAGARLLAAALSEEGVRDQGHAMILEARALVEEGCRVTICARGYAALQAAARELEACGTKLQLRPPRLLAVRADLTTRQGVDDVIARTAETFGGLDILVNNAGVGVLKPLVEMDLASFERVFATNVTGAMLMTREAAKHFIQRKSGHIVNIGSTAAVRGAARGTAYYASKFALRGMTECWRAELRPFNIRVILVNPSEVLTDFYATAGMLQNTQNPTKLRGEDIAHAVRSALEMDDRGFITELTVFATNPKD